MTEEEQALNRQIAECFEPCPTEPPRLDSESWSKTGAWLYAGTGPCVSLIFGNSEEWQPRDFLHDETANAMLLDVMRKTKCVTIIIGEQDNQCAVIVMDTIAAPFKIADLVDYPQYWLDSIRVMNPDRKAAVCQAFLAMHKKEKA